MPPSEETVEVSENGKDYREVAATPFSRQLPEKGRKTYTDSITFTPSEATYVKVTIRNGGILRNGIDYKSETPEDATQANLYIDEIEIY